jgi:hypothetical protein
MKRLNKTKMQNRKQNNTISAKSKFEGNKKKVKQRFQLSSATIRIIP